MRLHTYTAAGCMPSMTVQDLAYLIVACNVWIAALTIVLQDRVFECLIDRKVEPHIGDHAYHAGQPSLPQRNDALLLQASAVYALDQT